MNKRESAKRIYTAIEKIDTDLLYDARAYHAPKMKPYLRYAVAAVIALAFLTSALILISTKTVTDYVTIDTNYGATLELNRDRRIVKAKAASSMYHHTAQACTNLKYQEAAAQLIDKMSERGGLSKIANTILIGAPDNSANVADELLESLDATEYCVMRVDIEDETAAEKLAKKRDITKGKAALLLDINSEKNSLDENRLFRLSANDIALLLQSKRITSDAFTVSGTPLDGGYLSKEAVIQIAQKAAKLTPDKIVCELDSDGFKLIYNVMLYAGDKGAAYIIGAATGEIQWDFHGAANALRGELNKTHEQYGTASENTPPYQTTPNPVISNPDTTIISAATPTQIPATGFVAPTEKQPARSTEKSEPTTADPTTAPIAAPTEPSKKDAPTEADELPFVPLPPEPQTTPAVQPDAPSDDSYMTAHGIHDNSIQAHDTPIDGDWVFTAHRVVTDYYERNPYAILITNREQLLRYWEDYPDMKANSFYQNRYLSDGWFDDHALLYATNTEYYDLTYHIHWYAVRNNSGLLFVAWYDSREQYDLSLEKPFDIPNSVTCGIELNANLSNIKTMWLTKLTWKDTRSLIWLS